ncbi:hypothetical protein Ahy_B05g074993 isoform E [Arachis hypogaea]|uniref:Uncharacterized protein n=1 Tax=Arachis hypogaea TaxID=3818 RepID=A0A444Z0A1_ARAHY|nr:hypothetical protein Ahy_B05g074993 isoform E [Arachis hypogaea]
MEDERWLYRLDGVAHVAGTIDEEIVWEPYGSLDVLAVIHLEILAEEHSRLWRTVTSLIYFAVIEWHQIDLVLLDSGIYSKELDSHFLSSSHEHKRGRGMKHTSARESLSPFPSARQYQLQHASRCQWVHYRSASLFRLLQD